MTVATEKTKPLISHPLHPLTQAVLQAQLRIQRKTCLVTKCRMKEEYLETPLVSTVIDWNVTMHPNLSWIVYRIKPTSQRKDNLLSRLQLEFMGVRTRRLFRLSEYSLFSRKTKQSPDQFSTQAIHLARWPPSKSHDKGIIPTGDFGHPKSLKISYIVLQSCRLPTFRVPGSHAQV